MMEEQMLRIGELSRRTGVSPETLRAWERRYRLFSPARTEGGFRLYSSGDVARILAMKQLLATGVAASEAARRVVATGAVSVASEPPAGGFEQRVVALRDALLSYDEPRAHGAIDAVLAEFDPETLMRAVFLPILREIGDLWEAGQLSVAQEHFASNLMRRRLDGFARGWDVGVGPLAVLACPPEEEHDIPLLIFGIALGNRGWRITYLGARTPVEDLLRAISTLDPAVVVLASPRADAFDELEATFRSNGSNVQLLLAGAGATPELAGRLNALLLEQDPVSAASRVAALGLPEDGRAR
jgi:DNA-binding transcriptional MerR regulator